MPCNMLRFTIPGRLSHNMYKYIYIYIYIYIHELLQNVVLEMLLQPCATASCLHMRLTAAAFLNAVQS